MSDTTLSVALRQKDFTQIEERIKTDRASLRQLNNYELETWYRRRSATRRFLSSWPW